MDFSDSPEEAAFRQDLRDWLSSRTPFPTLSGDDDIRGRQLGDWHRQLFEGGWLGVTFGEEWGGRGLPAVYEAIVLDELGRAGAPAGWHYGYVSRVIERFGTDVQRRRYLRPALSGEELWCQGFSEPDAGSDLAGLRTSARLDADAYVVNGQKVWTSEAHKADYCLLIARTDPDGPKHRGLSCLVVATDAPGVTVRPFRQITGGLEFAEVFFDEVRVPVENLIGEPGQGWTIAMSTVAAERGPADVGFIADLQRVVGAVRAAISSGRASPDAVALAEFERAAVGVEVLRVHVQRTLSMRDDGQDTDAQSSIDKVLMSWVEQDLAHAVLGVYGSAVLMAGDPAGDPVLAEAWRGYLWSRASTIYGGTEQIQKGIIAQRILGLPRDR